MVTTGVTTPANVYVAPACVTVSISPAIVSVPVRVAPAFAS